MKAKTKLAGLVLSGWSDEPVWSKVAQLVKIVVFGPFRLFVHVRLDRIVTDKWLVYDSSRGDYRVKWLRK